MSSIENDLNLATSQVTIFHFDLLRAELFDLGFKHPVGEVALI